MAVEQVEFLIIGGGIAGLSVARALALAGHGTGTLVLDREPLMGFYASGHNAGIARQLTGRAEHTALTRKGCLALTQAGLMERHGGCLLAAEAGALDPVVAEAEAFGIPVERKPGSPVVDVQAAEHLGVPSDGVIDVDAMLHACAEVARAGGARLWYGASCTGIHPGPEGFEVETDRGRVRARYLVNAAGAWAQGVGRMAGGLDLAFQPLRRHLVWSPLPRPADHPWTWWVDRDLYLRPESGGLLLCACEEQSVALPNPGLQPSTDEAILEKLSGLLKDCAPALADLPIARLWSGLRTFAPDRRFVLGPDPRNPRLHWVAGLGGHGMTSGLAVGEQVARCLLGGADAGCLDPARLA